MLNREFCKLLNIDEFTQWIMNELDYLEQQLCEETISSCRYIELKSKYDTLKLVRDKYASMNKKKVH